MNQSSIRMFTPNVLRVAACALGFSTAALGCASTSEATVSEDNVTLSQEAEAFTKKICPRGGEGYVADSGCDLNDPELPRYRRELGRMYDLAPPFVQHVLRSVGNFYIERNVAEKNAASSWINQAGVPYIGLKYEVFSGGTFLEYSSRYEQSYLVGRQKGKVVPTLPHIVEAKGLDSVAASLLALVGHEIGHIALFTEERTRRSPSASFPDITGLRGLSSTELPWGGLDRVICRDGLSRPCRESIPHDSRTRHVGADDYPVVEPGAEDAFVVLEKSPFFTFFSFWTADEDFCEAMYHYVLSKVTDAVVWHLPESGKNLDMLAKLKAPRSAEEQQRADALKGYDAWLLSLTFPAAQ